MYLFFFLHLAFWDVWRISNSCSVLAHMNVSRRRIFIRTDCWKNENLEPRLLKNAGFLKLRYTYRNVFIILAVSSQDQISHSFMHLLSDAFWRAQQMCSIAPPDLRKCPISQKDTESRAAVRLPWIQSSLENHDLDDCALFGPGSGNQWDTVQLYCTRSAQGLLRQTT